MDVPVALGVAGAFAASAWSMVTGRGAVYFDSMTMFVALLLVARFAEHLARAKAARSDRARRARPAADGGPPAAAIRRSRRSTVAAHALVDGRPVRVAAGRRRRRPTASSSRARRGGGGAADRRKPARATRLRRRRACSQAPSTAESPLFVRVTAAGQRDRARGARAAGRARRRGAAAVGDARRGRRRVVRHGLLLVAAAGAALLLVAARRLACAARSSSRCSWCRVPARFRSRRRPRWPSAAGTLGRHGVVAVRAATRSKRSRGSTDVVLDKTGTLTAGRPRLVEVRRRPGPRMDSRRVPCASRRRSRPACRIRWPARALRRTFDDRHRRRADAHDVAASPGEGVEGIVEGAAIAAAGRRGSRELAHAVSGADAPDEAHRRRARPTMRGWLATVRARRCAAPSAAARSCARCPRARHDASRSLSGDRAPARARASPKHAGIARLARRRCARRTSAPSFARARQEGARGRDDRRRHQRCARARAGRRLDRASATRPRSRAGRADIVVLGDDVLRIGDAFALARRTLAVVRQNLGWALAYNASRFRSRRPGWCRRSSPRRSACRCPRCSSSAMPCASRAARLTAMDILFLLIPLAVVLVFLIGAAFWWCVASPASSTISTARRTGSLLRRRLDAAIDVRQRRGRRCITLPSDRDFPRIRSDADECHASTMAPAADVQLQGGAPVHDHDRRVGHRRHARGRDHRRAAPVARVPGRHPLALLRPAAPAAHQRGDLRVRRLRALRDVVLRGAADLPGAPVLRAARGVHVLGLDRRDRARRDHAAAGLHQRQGIRRARVADRHPDHARVGLVCRRVLRHDLQAQDAAHLRRQLVLRRASS